MTENAKEVETQVDYKKELERSYRALQALYRKLVNNDPIDQTMMAYHSLTIGAAIRYVDEQALDGSEFFIGKPATVLSDVLLSVRH